MQTHHKTNTSRNSRAPAYFLFPPKSASLPGSRIYLATSHLSPYTTPPPPPHPPRRATPPPLPPKPQRLGRVVNHRPRALAAIREPRSQGQKARMPAQKRRLPSPSSKPRDDVAATASDAAAGGGVGEGRGGRPPLPSRDAAKRWLTDPEPQQGFEDGELDDVIETGLHRISFSHDVHVAFWIPARIWLRSLCVRVWQIRTRRMMAARTATASSPRATAAATTGELSFPLLRSIPPISWHPFRCLNDMLVACSRCLSRAAVSRIRSPEPPVGLVL
jgi:hypothetical protein